MKKKINLLLTLVLTLTFSGVSFGSTLKIKNYFFSFKTKFSGYPDPQDFQRLLSKKFSFAFEYSSYRCPVQDASVLGANSVASGQPIFQEPSLAFVKWYESCIDSVSKDDFLLAVLFDLGVDHYFSPKAYKDLITFETEQPQHFGSSTFPNMAKNDGTSYKQNDKNAVILERPWSSLPETLRAEVATDLVEHLVGPQVLDYESEFTTALAERVKTSDRPFGEVVIKLIKLIVITPEFLTSAP